MKRAKKDQLWYNACAKEIGGILLEGREAALRCRGPYPDARVGLRMMGVHLEFPANLF